MNGETFVMYRSYFNTYEILRKKRPEDAQRFLDAIVRYGFTGEMPEEDDDIWMYNLETNRIAIMLRTKEAPNPPYNWIPKPADTIPSIIDILP